ncbi:response regulator [Aliivibrio sp. S4TY2]|uniref:response regulator n=1 Tax=unclassified Aliivibrio TaxID=2645654 RepID=UPI0023782348|nr:MULTISPECIES: response regulator [unclassified Aliivibrio]MDD9158116.1 response regulator [Aliivibrio sp. S4TY2]MDD9162031.1 response regulator [Aliivibrio sp. S4TY1]MDD9166113.1 response regulator [Aliivibrio sp. S4MY2]MDD9170111.1 response regulator [Aliivibrio sp. S4MY4]MDD9187162.1 response regulator [Aliivibrio sp. S4MY3]
MEKKQHFKRLQNTLMIAFLALSITPLSIIAIFFLHSHSQDLATQSTAHLVSLRDNKEQQITDYFKAKKSEVLGFARSELANASGGRFYGLVSAFPHLGSSIENARENAQQRYIEGSGNKIRTSILPESNSYIGSERYRLLHKRYHWAYQELLKRSDFTDILLVDIDGNVVYSTKKEDNYGTNLLTGKYKNTALEKTYSQVRDMMKKTKNKENIPVIFSDFAYINNENISWFAAPIVQQGYLHSFALFKLPNTGLSKLLDYKENNSTKTYFVGEDSYSRINNNDTKKNLSKNIIAALSGDKSVGSFTDKKDQKVLAAFTPITIDNHTWGLSIELPEKEAFARIQQLEQIFIVAMIIAIVSVVIASHFLSNSITAPLLRLTWAAERVSAGDLDQDMISTDRKDEIGRLAVSFARMQRSIREKIQLIKTQNEELEANLALIQNKNKELEATDKLKDEFLATTSHELRTPLHGMVGIAEALYTGANGPISASHRHQLEIIINSGQRLTNLVNDLLDYHKMRHGNLDINRHVADLSAATSLVLELSQHLLGNKTIRIINQVDKSLPSVYADEQRLEQVLYNLIGNAIKYTSEGKIVISASVVDQCLRVQVVDTGHGIPADELEHIFEPLIQAGHDSNRYRQGSGLGLSISRQLIELMGGSLYVSSQPMVGATFSFTIPLATKEQIQHHKLLTKEDIAHYQTPEKLEYNLDELAEEIPENPDGPLLLVADDEPVNLQVLSSFLKLEGYRVKTANDGPETLQVLKEEKPELLLLDVMMPGMSGYEVCQSLRQEYNHSQLPIIMLTALNQTQDRVRGFESGANDYLSKPFNKQELAARIKAHIQASQTEGFINENSRLLQEIRHREKVEASLLETQTHILEQLNHAHEAIICAKKDGNIQYVNHAAAKLFQRTEEQLTRYSIDELIAKRSLIESKQNHRGNIDVYIDGGIEQINADLLHLPAESGLSLMLIVSHKHEASEQRIHDLESAVEALSAFAFDGDKQKLDSLSLLNGDIAQLVTKANENKDDKGTIMRELIVDGMTSGLLYWEESTGQTKYTLAEESGLWRVYLDRSTLQTRTLDKYLRVETLPKTPRWRTVISTLEYILTHCEQHNTQREKLVRIKDKLQILIASA